MLRFRRLERKLFSAWCQWLCYPSRSKSEEAYSKQSFIDVASEVDEALSETNGSFFLAEGFGPADIVFLPYIERMSASLFYYKGYDLRREFEHIHAWFQGWEQRDTYRGFVSDFSTHVHDLPPQMGGCYTNNSKQSRVNAKIVDCGPFAVNEENERGRKGEQISDPLASEVSVRSFPEPQDSKETACYRVLRHWDTLADINPFGKEAFAVGMRAVLTYLLTGNLVKFSDTDRKSSADGEAQRDSSATDQSQKPKKEKKIKLSEVENIVLALIYVRDRISVPRDMPIWSGRRLREACDKVCKHNYAFDYHTAGSDGAGHLVLSGADVDARRYGKYDLKNSAMLRTRFDQCPVPFIGDPSTLLPPKHLRR